MSKTNGWAVLFAATAFELVSTVYMDAANGFSKPRESVIACIFYAASFIPGACHPVRLTLLPAFRPPPALLQP